MQSTNYPLTFEDFLKTNVTPHFASFELDGNNRVDDDDQDSALHHISPLVSFASQDATCQTTSNLSHFDQLCEMILSQQHSCNNLHQNQPLHQPSLSSNTPFVVDHLERQPSHSNHSSSSFSHISQHHDHSPSLLNSIVHNQELKELQDIENRFFKYFNSNHLGCNASVHEHVVSHPYVVRSYDRSQTTSVISHPVLHHDQVVRNSNATPTSSQPGITKSVTCLKKERDSLNCTDKVHATSSSNHPQHAMNNTNINLHPVQKICKKKKARTNSMTSMNPSKKIPPTHTQKEKNRTSVSSTTSSTSSNVYYRGHISNSNAFSKESFWQFHTYSEGKRNQCNNLIFYYFKPPLSSHRARSRSAPCTISKVSSTHTCSTPSAMDVTTTP
ncbi:hypothetical protein C9374_013483 [Naegleria lovaniensis]|uniref:Uncharacterized protein n=1 Tax=Naegleria lovaniensis TaxID=51637 RepID=A0AA88GVW4_NAELO|nr:uncharacterized protein C9374_013483 [Naegleria lovaniensis]KAG2391998.1 hypothetical protein C9374_013483 [Naegleria lovaniensis]